MRWQYGTSDGSEFLAVHGFKQLAFAKLGHLVSCWHLDTGYVKTFDTVTRALAESLQAPFAEPAPYFVEIKTTTAVGSRVGVFMSTLQREASGGIRARQVTALMIPGSGEMHSHFADHLVLLRADGSLLSAGHSILRDGAPALKVELRQRDGLWTVDGQREGSPMRATLAAGSKPATWVEQAQDLRRILAAENPVGMESVQTMWIAAKPAELVETRTRVVARNSADEFAALLLLPRYESKIVLDRATGLASRAEVPRGSTTVLVERVYVSGSP
jgi:hypothetical protein